MNYIQALNKLIDRNKALVRKSGISIYTKETDDIINVLLDQIKIFSTENDSLNSVLKHTENNRNVCFEIFGIPEDFKTIDPDFLQRYLEYNLVPQIWISNGGDPQNYELSEQSILEQYRFAQTEIERLLEIYLIVKPHLLLHPDIYKKLYPQFYDYAKYNYTDEQVKQEIKRTIYYNYE